MKISKAIEILTIHNDHNPDYTDLDRRDAHNLSIEALKKIKSQRKRSDLGGIPTLPGEEPE